MTAPPKIVFLGRRLRVIPCHQAATLGYLYRNFIPALVQASYRAIVPDHLGFGRSDKPDRPDLYRIPRHASRLEALLDSLDLHEATFVVQDWGGPIGLNWAVRHPDRVRSLCILNTFAQRPTGPMNLPFALHLFRTPSIGEVMVKGLHMFVKAVLFKVGVTHPERLDANARAAYLAPHPDWASRTGVLVFPREIPSGPDGAVSEFLGELEKGLAVFNDKPMLIVWAMQDPAFTPEVLETKWIPAFPRALGVRIADAGHYLQEDAHEVIVPRLLELLRA